MRQFIKFTFASCLGVFIAMALVFFFFFVIAVSVGSGGSAVVPKNSVLRIAPAMTPPELTNNVAASPWQFSQDDILGVRDIILHIRRAKDDDHIKGIELDPTYLFLGPANAKALLAELIAFKESGKFIVSYGDYYNQGGYYLSSASDHIMLNPIGSVDFRGFASFVPFYTDLLDKTGMKMQIYYAGEFKSATEPFTRSEMSPQSKLQTREYLDFAYDEFLQDISNARGLSVSTLRTIASELQAKSASDAVELKLIDAVAHRDELTGWIRQQLELESDVDPTYIDIGDYAGTGSTNQGSSSNRIAVVFAEGAIIDGDGEYGTVSGKQYTEILEKLRDSKTIDAVVLRVNSPGGSILASENILQEVKLLKATGKPVVVSMSDYAASGGYYISAFADSIYAESNTLTGSIGVFTMIPNPHAMLEEKIGVHFDTVRTGPLSASFSPFFAWSDAEHAYMEGRTNAYYELFLKQVSEGRGMTRDVVHEMAQGRIWSGTRALELGLVDAVGDLDDAIACAARMAEIEDYRITAYPKVPDQITRLIEELSSSGAKIDADAIIQHKLKSVAPEYQSLLEMLSFGEPIARLPVLMKY